MGYFATRHQCSIETKQLTHTVYVVQVETRLETETQYCNITEKSTYFIMGS